MRMLSSALRRNRCHRAFKNFQQCLLNSLSAYITCNRWVFAFFGNFINFVDIYNSARSAFNIKIRSLNKTQQNILNIFTDIACLCKRCSIGNGKRNIQYFRKCLSKQSFSASCRSQKKNITLLKFNVGISVFRINSLIVIVYGNRKAFLCRILSYYVAVKLFFYFNRLRNIL